MLEASAQQSLQQGLQQTLEQGTQAVGDAAKTGPGSLEPDPTDVTRFEELLAAGPNGPIDSVNPPELNAVSMTEPVAEVAPTDIEAKPITENLGDIILQGMEKISTTHEGHINNVTKLLDDTSINPLSFQDGVRLQVELMQMNLQQDVTTKVADKTSQGIQTLFRNQ
ncbi:Type III secretion system inner rod subunit SctI [Sulfidibacter corallicola]|uniref:Type III secretion system inner rod subunit SctI n=1 Tax=Sulfidibacter corallicola TaxID=2818388 RepID=A0A8A4TMB3_SULCO|nr:type III secretion system inner rod subunit SctI [Sulfidibacter corallicola]QTD51129.1 type III secretion system inner rod subunit SctI [Sulfidibacter corallicola]